MNIRITNSSISFGSEEVEYESYYLRRAAQDDPPARVIKRMVEQWVEALQGLGHEARELYLPFSLDDEWVECFGVTRRGNLLAFERVRVMAGGWAVDIRNLKDFISAPHEIRTRFPGAFGSYERDEILKALSEAEVCDAASR